MMIEQGEPPTFTSASFATLTGFYHPKPLRIKTVLVPIDFATASMQALDYAIPLARQFDSAIHLVHVQYKDDSSSSATAHLMRDMAQKRARIRDRLAKVPGEHTTPFRAENCHVCFGIPHEEIVKLAGDIKADLIVLSSRGHTGLPRVVMGSTAERVVRHAACPVLVTRQRPRGEEDRRISGSTISLGKILVPLDFSDCALEGLAYALSFAKAWVAKILLFHAIYPPIDFVADRVTGLLPHLRADEEGAAKKQMRDIMAKISSEEAQCEFEITIGPPISEICRRSDRPDIDLIITSTHGRTGFEHALMGSVAEQVVRYAGCPVLTVPTRR